MVIIVLSVINRGGIKEVIYRVSRQFHFVPQNNHFTHRLEHFKSLEIPQEATVFLGDSLIELGNWDELFSEEKVYNRGISGLGIEGLVELLEEGIVPSSSHIYVLVGINNFWRKEDFDSIEEKIVVLLRKIKEANYREVTIIGLLPTFQTDLLQRTAELKRINEVIERLSSILKFKYLDVSSFLVDESAKYLKKSYSSDGVHLNGRGYLQMKKAIQSKSMNSDD